MALRIYDIQTDEWREPTQLDIDQMAEVAASYGRLRQAVTEEHAALQERLRKLRMGAREIAGTPL